MQTSHLTAAVILVVIAATPAAGEGSRTKSVVATSNNDVRTAGALSFVERDDVRQLSRAIEASGYRIDHSGLRATASDGLLIPITSNKARIRASSDAPTVDRTYVYYRRSTGSASSPYLIVTMASVDDIGRPYVEFQLPGFAVRFTSVDETFHITEVASTADGARPNLASRLAGGVTTNAWDFNAIKQCFLSFLGINNLSQLSGKIDAYCSLNETAKDVLTIATHGSSCVTLGALSCVYFGTYLTYFLTCGAANVVSCVNGDGGGACAHSECSIGSALSKSCSTCVSTVCAADPYCCNNSWDVTCVNEAKQWCGSTCSGGGNPSNCAHSPCVTGAALTKSCSSCVTTVCNADSYCCTNSWDGLCVSEAKQWCGNLCQ